jgi:hypothetical protein
MEQIHWEYAYAKNKKKYLMGIFALMIAIVVVINFLSYFVNNATFEMSYDNYILFLSYILIILVFITLILINYITIPRDHPYKIGFSKDQIHLRYKNKIYDTNIDKENVITINKPISLVQPQLKLILKTGGTINISGIHSYIKKVHKNLTQ